MKDQVFELVSKVLRVPVVKITENSSPADLDRWDSLRHIDMVMDLEQEFNVQFTENQIIEMLTNVGTIVRILGEIRNQ